MGVAARRVLLIVALILLSWPAAAAAQWLDWGGIDAADTVIVWDGAADVSITQSDGKTAMLEALALATPADLRMRISEKIDIEPGKAYTHINVLGARLVIRSDIDLSVKCAVTVPTPAFCALVTTVGDVVGEDGLNELNTTDEHRAEIAAMQAIGLVLTRVQSPSDVCERIADPLKPYSCTWTERWALPPGGRNTLAELVAVLGATHINIGLDADITVAPPVSGTPIFRRVALAAENATDISVSIVTPAEGATFGDPFRIVANVVSSRDIAEVRAIIDGRPTTLVLQSCSVLVNDVCRVGSYAANIAPEFLAGGQQKIVVEARNNTNDTVDGDDNGFPDLWFRNTVAIAERYSLLDRPPILTVTSPLQNAVAHPLVHVVATCRDDNAGGCVSITIALCGANYTFFGSTVDTWVPGCGSPGPNNIVITGTDSSGQMASYQTLASRYEGSTALAPFAVVDGLILDVRDTRILYVRYLDSLSQIPQLRIRTTTTGADAIVPVPDGYRPPATGYLTPFGAIFITNISSALDAHVFELRTGTIVDLGAYGAYFDIDGDYAAWVSDGVAQQTLVLRNLVAGSTTHRTVTTRVVNLNVGPNGDVVFMSNVRMNAYDILRLQGATLTQLTSGTAYTFDNPRTDGVNVMYTRAVLAGQTGTPARLLYTSSEIPLGDPTFGGDVRGGWALYANSLGEVWRRSPFGILDRVATSGGPRTIAANGDAWFGGSDGLYLGPAGGAPRRIATTTTGTATPYMLAGLWYVALGNTLYSLNNASCTFTVTPSSRAFGAGGGTGTFAVHPTNEACLWTTTGVPSWITVYFGSSSAGDDIVRFGVALNFGGSREATLAIAGQMVNVSQRGAGSYMRVPSDFTGDGRADRAVFRPFGGQWLIEGLLPIQWGQPHWIPVAGDYNGDGITDIASYAPENGTWYVRGVGTVQYGLPGDIPVPADWNGDRVTDVAVFRPSSGRWFVKDQFALDWGLPGDIPVPGDYDGNGRSDVAVFRPSTGFWYINGVAYILWGRPGDIPVPADYNGDGRTDVAVYRPSTGFWYVKDVFSVQYGLAGDLPIPLDVDGDGRASVAVYRRSTGTFFVEGFGPGVRIGGPSDLPIGCLACRVGRNADLDGDQRSDGATWDRPIGTWLMQLSAGEFYNRRTFPFGLESDIRRAADFDADGRADLVLFRPSTGAWYALRSSTGGNDYLSLGSWGLSTDVPLPADYDGDRQADLMVFRASQGRWYLKTSSSGYVNVIVIDWGLPGDLPVPADYDGDGKTDVAIFRPSASRWYIKRSSDGTMLVIDWGLATDVPVPADYDGDGRADAGVYRPSTGVWWIKQSTTDYATYLTSTFGGGAGDVATPGDYNGDGFVEPGYFRPDAGLFSQMLGRIAPVSPGTVPVTDR